VWYHVAAVSEGRESRIYVNGREVAAKTRAVAGIFTDDDAHLKIGNIDRYASEGPRPLRGSLDEVRITEKALPPGEFIKTREPMPEVTGPVPDQYEMPFSATSQQEAIQWQTRARARLFELVEDQQPRRSTDEVPADFQIGEPEDKADYTLYQASFQGNDAGTRYPCLMAIPKGEGPFPAMLAIHGHGGSAEAVFNPGTIYHGFADRFARGGYVVLAPSFPHRKYCAMMLWDLFRLVDILQSRTEVDSDRIGVGGLSMGGEWTMWIAACDTRLKVAVVSGWMCTTEGVFSVPNCACWELPGFVELMDVCEVHLLIAPRPLLFESAEHDCCFPIRHTKEGYARVRAGYKVFGEEEAVAQDVWPAGHEWHGVMAYPLVDKVLGGRAAKVD
jgi:acetyl esterase/lipase